MNENMIKNYLSFTSHKIISNQNNIIALDNRVTVNYEKLNYYGWCLVYDNINNNFILKYSSLPIFGNYFIVESGMIPCSVFAYNHCLEVINKQADSDCIFSQKKRQKRNKLIIF